jgi:hypothetical protein
MSISQLLTITESHGFRALLSVAVWIFGVLAQLGRGLRNLSGSNTEFARTNVGGGSWLGILIGEFAIARRGPVLWYDTYEGRGAPLERSWRHRHRLLDGSAIYSPALALARQARGAGRGKSRT